MWDKEFMTQDNLQVCLDGLLTADAFSAAKICFRFFVGRRFESTAWRPLDSSTPLDTFFSAFTCKNQQILIHISSIALHEHFTMRRRRNKTDFFRVEPKRAPVTEWHYRMDFRHRLALEQASCLIARHVPAR